MSKLYAPRAYQTPATNFMLENDRCALWAGCGLGKTVATLTALEALYTAGEEKPTLILAPLRVARSTWSEETTKWDHLADLRVVPIVGTAGERAAAVMKPAQVYTTNYENIEWLIDKWGDRWPYGTIVADESTKLKGLRLSVQHGKKKDGSEGKEFLRGAGGKRSKALGKVAHLHAHRFLELTGTPSPNGLKDLWGQVWFLDAGKRLGRTYDAFTQRWFEKGRDGFSVKPRDYASVQIHELLADICMSIDAKDYFDLKEPIVNNVYVDLPPKARALYREMEEDLFIQLSDRTAEAFNAATKSQKILQLASGACYVDPLAETDSSPTAKEWREVHKAKLEALEDIIEEACGAPVIVAYQYRSDLERLQRAFPQGRHLQTKKDEDDFKAGKIPVLFAHSASAGHGIDGFQRVCNIMVFFTMAWDLEQYLQIIERIGPVRQMQSGMDRPVFIHHIIARDTIDEDVLERGREKKSVQDILLEAMKRRKA
jgi:SNF2 family DNA or RNA helicase